MAAAPNSMALFVEAFEDEPLVLALPPLALLLLLLPLPPAVFDDFLLDAPFYLKYIKSVRYT